MKALSVAYGINPQKTHDFGILTAPIRPLVAFSEDIDFSLAMLQKYETLPRYGGGWTPNRFTASRAIDCLDMVSAFVKENIRGHDLDSLAEKAANREYHEKKSMIADALSVMNIDNPKSETATEYAEGFYSRIVGMASDVKRISKNMKVPEYMVNAIKQYLFVEKHRFDDGETKRNEPRFDIAQSWARMAFFPKEIKPHDRLLLQHMAWETVLVNANGKTVEDARACANRRINYDRQSREFYRSLRNKGKSLVD